MDSFENFRIRQLDDTLAPFAALLQRDSPRSGWVQCIRQALGMSLRQLASRTGMSKTGVYSAEESEAKGTIQMDTLKRLAHGMD